MCCSAYLFKCARRSYKEPAYGACKNTLVQPMTKLDKECWSRPPAACGRCRLPSSLNADLDTACDSGARCACAPAAGSLTMSPPLRRMPLRCTVFPPAAVPVRPVRSRDTWLYMAETWCLAAVIGHSGMRGVRLTGVAGYRALPAAHRLVGSAHHRADCLNRSRRSQRRVTVPQLCSWRPRRLQTQRRRVWRR